MRVRHETFRAFRRPADGPPDLRRRPDAGRLLGIDENLRAEAAADIGRDDPELVFRRDADEGGEDEPGDMRVLARRVERVAARTLVIFADGRARLHRVRDQTIIDEVELHHLRRLGESRLRLRLVAEFPLEAGVVRRFGMNLRRSRGLTRRERHGGRQFLIIDVDHLGGGFRLCLRLGDDHRDVVADIAHRVEREHGMRADLHRRAVLGMHGPAADQSAELVGGDVLAGEDRDDAGRRQRRFSYRWRGFSHGRAASAGNRHASGAAG